MSGKPKDLAEVPPVSGWIGDGTQTVDSGGELRGMCKHNFFRFMLRGFVGVDVSFAVPQRLFRNEPVLAPRNVQRADVSEMAEFATPARHAQNVFRPLGVHTTCFVKRQVETDVRRAVNEQSRTVLEETAYARVQTKVRPMQICIRRGRVRQVNLVGAAG
jgi:hypothetical protein